MPKAGLEPARPMTFDFESNASAISPFGHKNTTFQHICTGKLPTSFFLFLGPRASDGRLHHPIMEHMRFELMTPTLQV